MLDKLLKYEIKAIGRTLLPLFAAWLAMSILLGTTIKLVVDKFPILVGLVGLLYGAMAIAVVIMAIVVIIQRFYKNLLGNEGYLTLTLPVTMNKHIMSKTIASTLWATLATICGLFSIAIILLVGRGFDETWNFVAHLFSQLWQEYGVHSIQLLVITILTVIFNLAYNIVRVYAAIATGHQFNKNRILLSVIFYIAFGCIEMILGVIALNINFEDWFMNLDASFLYKTYLFVGGVFLITTIKLVIYYFVTYKLLKRKINLD